MCRLKANTVFGKFALQDIYRELGPLTLCGVLYVAYQTPEYTTGDFMVCTLFNSYLMFAKGVDDFRRLEAVACIYVDDVRMDTIQNGHGKTNTDHDFHCQLSWFRAPLLRVRIFVEDFVPRAGRELRGCSQRIVGSRGKALEDRDSEMFGGSS